MRTASTLTSSSLDALLVPAYAGFVAAPGGRHAADRGRPGVRGHAGECTRCRDGTGAVEAVPIGSSSWRYDYRRGRRRRAPRADRRRDGEERDIPWSLDLYEAVGVPPWTDAARPAAVRRRVAGRGPRSARRRPGREPHGSCATTPTSWATRRPCRSATTSKPSRSIPGLRWQRRAAADRSPASRAGVGSTLRRSRVLAWRVVGPGVAKPSQATSAEPSATLDRRHLGCGLCGLARDAGDQDGLAHDRGLAGVGFWAIGYERGLPGYTDVMSRSRTARRSRSPVPPGPSRSDPARRSPSRARVALSCGRLGWPGGLEGSGGMPIAVSWGRLCEEALRAFDRLCGLEQTREPAITELTPRQRNRRQLLERRAQAEDWPVPEQLRRLSSSWWPLPTGSRTPSRRSLDGPPPGRRAVRDGASRLPPAARRRRHLARGLGREQQRRDDRDERRDRLDAALRGTAGSSREHHAGSDHAGAGEQHDRPPGVVRAGHEARSRRTIRSARNRL